jgi:5-methylthioadenosine/S-adenosylhomocysteine deaminase
MRILIRNGLILTLDSQDHVYDGGDLLVEDGSITRIEQQLDSDVQADKVIDASGKLVAPGFVNAHLHSYDAYSKGMAEDVVLEVWFPSASMGLRRPLTQHELRVRTLLVASEMLRSGITSGYDDCTLVPLDRESVDTVMTAYRDSGMRAIVGATVLNRPLTETMPYLDEIMPAEVRQKADSAPIAPDSELVGLCRWMIEKWNGEAGRLHVGLAPSAPQRCTDEFVLAMDDLSKQYDVPWNMHVLETKVQAVTGPEFYGQTIVEHLAHLGVLTPRLALIHGVWLKAHDMELLAAGGTSVVHNPVSNLKVGSGIAPIRDMLKAGVNVALGCDNSGAVDTQSMFETIKFAALLPEVEGPEFGVWEPARDVLRMATIGGARSVLLENSIGSLEVGKKADIVLYDLARQPFTPLNDPIRQLVYGETGRSVDTVLVDGKVVLQGGQFLTMDEGAMLREAKEIGRAFRQEDEKAERFAEVLRPHLESMYWRSVTQDVGINRYSRPFPAE